MKEKEPPRQGFDRRAFRVEGWLRKRACYRNGWDETGGGSWEVGEGASQGQNLPPWMNSRADWSLQASLPCFWIALQKNHCEPEGSRLLCLWKLIFSYQMEIYFISVSLWWGCENSKVNVKTSCVLWTKKKLKRNIVKYCVIFYSLKIIIGLILKSWFHM